MIRNNDIIQGYTVLMVANGMVLAHSETAPDPYVVWHTTEDRSGVYGGKYLPNKEDAEWDFCMKAFPWFEDNAPVTMIEDEAQKSIENFKDHLEQARTAIDFAAALVEDMVAEHERLISNKKAPQEENAEPVIDYISGFDFEMSAKIQSSVSDLLSKTRSKHS